MSALLSPSGTAAHLLSRHVRIRTVDAQQATYESNRLMSPHMIRTLDSHQFGWMVNAAQVGRSTLIYNYNQAAVEITASAPTGCFILHLVLDGEVSVASDRGQVDLTQKAAACVVSPTRRLHLRFAPQTRQLVVRIPTVTVEQAFGHLTGESGGRDIVFGMSASEPGAWPSSVLLAVNTIDAFDSGMPLPARIGDELERIITSSLLLAHPHSSAKLITQSIPNRAARAVTEVADRITASPEQSFDFADLAATHGIALRTLQAGFKHRFGCPPSRYLREARLELAHSILTTEPEASVTEAALNSGFTHLSRFAIEYRTRYGVAPSRTLEDTRHRARNVR